MAAALFLRADRISGGWWRYQFSIVPGKILYVTSPLGPSAAGDPLVTFAASITAAQRGHT